MRELDGTPRHLLALPLAGFKASRIGAQTSRGQQVDGTLLVGRAGFTVSVLVHEQIGAHPLFPAQAAESFAALRKHLRNVGRDG